MQEPPNDAVAQPPSPHSPVGSNTDATVLVLAALFVLDSFLAWYRVRYTVPVPGIPARVVGVIGWRSGFLAWASILVAIATAAFAGMRISGESLKMRITPPAVYLLAGVTMFFMTALRFLIKPSGLSGLAITALNIRVTRAFGLYVALLLAIGMLVTAFRGYQATRRS